nr:glutathione S-transferase C-terminal domain-containing protein [Caulobacteraceae bacterium]
PLKERGAYYRWLFFAAGPVEAAWTNKSLGFVVPPGRERMAGYGTFERTIDTLEQAVSGRDYICGDRFSAADVYVGSQIGFGMQFGGFDRRPAFTSYWERISARPAHLRGNEIDGAMPPPPPVAAG